MSKPQTVAVIYNDKELSISKEAYLIDSKKPQNERKYFLNIQLTSSLLTKVLDVCYDTVLFKKAVNEHLIWKLVNMTLFYYADNCFKCSEHGKLMSSELFMSCLDDISFNKTEILRSKKITINGFLNNVVIDTS